MKRWKQGFTLLLVCVSYGLVSLYGAYVALSKSETGVKRYPGSQVPRDRTLNVDSHQEQCEFAIWDTCGLGIYLWRNILHGEITQYNLNNGWIQSSLKTDNFSIKYNLGYGLTPDYALTPSNPNIVLVVNARDTNLIPNAKLWVDHVLKSAYIEKVAIILLGSETCDNDWLQPYLQQSRIKCVFMVYDSTLVDDELVFQWPLGVASYRNFQNFNEEFLDLSAQRPYVFNFIGTVYDGSSRVGMMNTVHKHIKNQTKKYTKTRENWVPEEDSESMTNYQHVLLASDLTLSPAGRNSECYRTYEAMELGSIPVIEDVVSEGTCDYNENKNYSSPYRLLKKYGAPVIFVKNWENELPNIVQEFQEMTHRAKVRSRINLIRWYVDFKKAMRDKFLHIVSSRFC
ncbi:ribitol-5-phosphate xylosyltransferase 1-like [Styela clava]